MRVAGNGGSEAGGRKVSAVAWHACSLHLCVVHAERRTYGGRAGHARRAQSRGRATVYYVPAIYIYIYHAVSVSCHVALGERRDRPQSRPQSRCSHGSPRCWNDGSPWPMGMGGRGLDASACAGREIIGEICFGCCRDLVTGSRAGAGSPQPCMHAAPSTERYRPR